jgi:hypothetical protein
MPITAMIVPVPTGGNSGRSRPKRLDQCHQAAAEQVCADEQSDLLGCKFQSTANDERHGNRTRIHHEHVLQTERDQPADGQYFVDR